VSAITLERVSKTYPNGHVACRAVDLHIADGELLVLVGPSGCGKSTLLRLIAGLEMPGTGRILIDDADVTTAPPQLRDLAMVFQSYALYPHMTVRENLAYGLRVRRTDRRTIETRVGGVAAALDIESLLDRRPAQLSGGQRQRVALGRALVRDPKAFLLDEPLSNLDPALRVQARAELLRLQQRLHATIVHVTHDQEEALTLGHRVAVMHDGRVSQVAPPLDLYARPANTFVARFIGSPPMNLLPASLAGIDAGPGMTIGIRPHDVAIDGSGTISATVDVVERRGHDTVIHARTGMLHGATITAVVPGDPPSPGAQVRLQLPADRIHVFDESGMRRA
jgi:ABC-type sugar transport system ATPase subunit